MRRKRTGLSVNGRLHPGVEEVLEQTGGPEHSQGRDKKVSVGDPTEGRL